MPSHLPNPRVPQSMDAPPLRWGVLGTGWIADRFVTALHESTRQVVQAVGSRSAEGARRAADAFGATTAHASYEALVADPEVDVVYVATPHHLHLPHAPACSAWRPCGRCSCPASTSCASCSTTRWSGSRAWCWPTWGSGSTTG